MNTNPNPTANPTADPAPPPAVWIDLDWGHKEHASILQERAGLPNIRAKRLDSQVR
jgi:hypothetical protein